jgi:hypothetical protein
VRAIRFTGRGKRLAAIAVITATAIASPPLRGVWAQTVHKRSRRTYSSSATTTTTSAPSASQQKIDQLSQELEEMKKQQAELMSQLKDLKQQMAVQAPGAAAAAAAGGAAGATTTAAAAPAAAASPVAPSTIGEHVATVEGDLAQTRKDLATNLGVHIHGLVDADYEKNLNNPGAGIPVTKGINSKINNYRFTDTDPSGFEIQQGNIHIDRTVEGGVGFVTDLNFGKTAEILSGATHYSNSSTPPTVEEFDPTQVYLTYTAPVGSGINISAGKFVTLLGEEVIKTYNNLNYNESNDYIFTLGIPFTHTGVRANYVFNEKLAATMGLNNGWDDPANVNSGINMEGQVALTPDPAFSVLVNGTFGPDQANHGNSKRGVVDPIATWKTPITGLQFIGEYLYAHEDGPVAVSPFLTGVNAGPNPIALFAPMSKGVTVIPHGVDWQAFAGYGVYDLNDKLQLALRGEWFRDSDGVRTGLRQTLYEGTFTTSYKIADGLTLRGEYRHDESNRKPFYTNHATPAAFLAGPFGPTLTRAGQDTFLGALIYAF